MNSPDWRQNFSASPLFNGLRTWTASLEQEPDWPGLERLNRLAEQAETRNAQGLLIQFLPQGEKCSQIEYEHGIYRSGHVPTRLGSWHDLFNALIWLAFPTTKAALNATHHAVLPGSSSAGRGPVSDAATLFDESGLVLIAQDATLADTLRAKNWKTAFWTERSRWKHARLYIVGHSLLEKSLSPTPGMTGKCLFIETKDLPDPGAGIPAWLDERIAEFWKGQEIKKPADLFPLPLMGVPGYADNGFEEYYDNTAVFRPARLTILAA